MGDNAVEATLCDMVNRAKVRAAVVAMIVLLTFLSALGQTHASATSRSQNRFARAVNLTFEKGAQAKLPPHISTLLGLAQEQECPVEQGVLRTGSTVQGIDVATANKNDVVLFVVDEAANNQVLYLTSPAGKLRKVVSVKAGTGAVSRITDEDRASFEKQKQFWADRLAAVAKGK